MRLCDESRAIIREIFSNGSNQMAPSDANVLFTQPTKYSPLLTLLDILGIKGDISKKEKPTLFTGAFERSLFADCFGDWFSEVSSFSFDFSCIKQDCCYFRVFEW